MREIINFQSEVINLERVNPLVSRYKLFIAYPDEPAKKYVFSLDVLNKLSSTIKGCPIVAGFMNGQDGSLLGGHESDLALNQNNQIARTPTPIPVGFADYMVNPWFEEYKGRQYLTTFIYVWDGRFPELSNLSERNIFQSMEVAVDDEQEGQYKIVKDAYAIGLCLMENVNPAFENSTIQKFAFSNINSEIDLLKQEYEQFVNLAENKKEANTDNLKDSKLDIENFTKEGENVIKEAVEKFSLNSDQIREILRNGLSQYKYQRGDYEDNKYYVDCYDAECVYVWDCEEDRNYSMRYQINDLVATIDIESKVEVIHGGYIPVGQQTEQMSQDEVKTEEMSTEENKEPATEDMSSNAYVDNTAMQELNDRRAEENKDLSAEQMNIDEHQEGHDKDKIVADMKEEMKQMEQKMKEMHDKMTEMEHKMMSYSEENTQLKEFKASIEKQNKDFAVETTLKEVVDIMPKDELENCRMSAENYSLDNIDVWKNEVQAKAFKFSKGIVEKKTHLQIGLPIIDKPKRGTGLWD